MSVVPVDSGSNFPEFCSLNSEFLIKSNYFDKYIQPIYGLTKHNDLAYYSVSLQDFGITQEKQLNSIDWSCLPEINRVVINSDESKARNSKIMFVVAGGRG